MLGLRRLSIGEQGPSELLMLHKHRILIDVQLVNQGFLEIPYPVTRHGETLQVLMSRVSPKQAL